MFRRSQVVTQQRGCRDVLCCFTSDRRFSGYGGADVFQSSNLGHVLLFVFRYWSNTSRTDCSSTLRHLVPAAHSRTTSKGRTASRDPGGGLEDQAGRSRTTG